LSLVHSAVVEGGEQVDDVIACVVVLDDQVAVGDAHCLVVVGKVAVKKIGAPGTGIWLTGWTSTPTWRGIGG
jgi:hypothetical protein